jgi:hypothetical protein
MSWIKSHSELKTHPKVKKAARTLGISIAAMIGHLHALWWWTLEYAPDGMISAYDPEEIADAVMWEGDIQTFFDALVDCGARDCHGLLDRNEQGDLFIHDWEEHCGDDYKKRTKEAERLKAYRAKKKEEIACTGTDENSTRTCTNDVRTSFVHGEKEKEKEKEKEQKTKDLRNTPQENGAVAPAPSEERYPGEQRPEEQRPEEHPPKTPSAKNTAEREYPEAFVQFWAAYPRRVDKQRAYEAWLRIRAPDRERVVLAARHYAEETGRLGTEPQYIRHPKTFLGKGGWEDWATGPPGAGGVSDAERQAIIAKHTDKEGQRDDRAILLEIRALENQRAAGFG